MAIPRQSVFTNRKNDADRHAFRYMEAVLELLGERDPFEVMRQQAAWLRDATSGLDDSMLRTPELPGKWSIIDVLRHLADSELIYRYRMRRIVAEPGFPILGYDQDAWAHRLRYAEADADETLAEFEALRRANLIWLRSLGDDELERTGRHDERGQESVRLMIRLLAGHDLVHRRQIDRIRKVLNDAG